MRRSKLLLSLLAGVTAITMSGCSKGGSKELTIVHFDQTILGDSQKDLGVSIGVKKGSDELKTKLNTALAKLTNEKRTELMLEAVDRSTGTYTTTKNAAYEVPSENTEGVLKVGLECDYAPFNWTDTSKNDYNYPIKSTNYYADGYDIQIARFLAKELNYSLEIVKLEWDALIPSLDSGTVNVVIAGMTDTEERRKSIDFTDEYYRSELVLVVKKDSKYASAKSLNEFKGARIVSQVSTVTDDVIENWKNEFEVKHLNALDTFATAAMAVQNGSADAMTAELPVANSIVNGSR